MAMNRHLGARADARTDQPPSRTARIRRRGETGSGAQEWCRRARGRAAAHCRRGPVRTAAARRARGRIAMNSRRAGTSLRWCRRGRDRALARKRPDRMPARESRRRIVASPDTVRPIPFWPRLSRGDLFHGGVRRCRDRVPAAGSPVRHVPLAGNTSEYLNCRS